MKKLPKEATQKTAKPKPTENLKANPELSHLDAQGHAQMVDVTAKSDTSRRAIARGRVLLTPATVALLRDNKIPKGDALGVARIAGILAAKRTSDLIPLCHPLPITKARVDLTVTDDGRRN